MNTGRKTIHKGSDLPLIQSASYKNFIINHDESWLFTFIYVGLAVVLSLYISMFWLIAVAVSHGALEWASLNFKGETERVVTKVFWHLRLDIVLIIFALWLGVYIDLIFGALGLGAAARGGAQVGSRVLAWQRTVRGALLTLDDVGQVLKAILAKRSVSTTETTGQHTTGEASIPGQKEENAWGKADFLLVVTGVLLVVSILAAPFVTEMGVSEVIGKIAGDLHPWP